MLAAAGALVAPLLIGRWLSGTVIATRDSSCAGAASTLTPPMDNLALPGATAYAALQVTPRAIDAAKAANVLATFSPGEVKEALGVAESASGTIDPYFGAGNVTKVKNLARKSLLPLIAVQTAASSGAR